MSLYWEGDGIQLHITREIAARRLDQGVLDFGDAS